MGFEVRKQSSRPEGTYIEKDGVTWMITNISLAAGTQIKLHLHDPIRLNNEIIQIDNLQGLLEKYGL
jgi:hypothetical protein